MSNEPLIRMMFEGRPPEEFERLLKHGSIELEWGQLLHMCYLEESYERIGGDSGYTDAPPINHERLSYLEALIAFWEQNGITAAKIVT